MRRFRGRERERERLAISPAFPSRGAACGGLLVPRLRSSPGTKGAPSTETSTTSARRVDRYLGAISLLPLLRFPPSSSLGALSIVGIPRTFTHAGGLIRDASTRINAGKRGTESPRIFSAGVSSASPVADRSPRLHPVSRGIL